MASGGRKKAKAKQTAGRERERAFIVAALEAGAHAFSLRVALPAALRALAVADATGDTLDAVACAVQAAWGAQRASSHYGLPPQADRLEGWIVGA